MSPPPPETDVTALRGKLVKGSWVNALGIVGKSLFPLYLVAITRLYGPSEVGIFLLAQSMIDILAAVIFGGFRDAVLLFAARSAHREDDHGPMYDALANAFVLALVACAVVVGAAGLFAPQLAAAAFEQPSVGPTLRALLVTLPLLAVAQLLLAATSALMIMTYDALLMGFVRPALLLATGAAASLVGDDAATLAWSSVAAHAALVICCVVAFARHFSLARLFGAARRFTLRRDVLAFAIPQNLNMALTSFLAGTDVLMLGWFGLRAELIAFYATAAQLMRQLRQIRLGISNAFSPLIARFHADGLRAELEETFNQVCRWSATIALPAATALLVFRGEILRLFHESYTHESGFMVLLGVAATLGCAVGMAGNLIVMTGHARVNLANTVLVAATNVIFNLALIPRFGLAGAAGGTLLATTALTAAQLVEARLLLGIRLRARTQVVPYGAALLAAAVAFALEAGGFSLVGASAGERAVALVGVGAAFGAPVLWERRRTLQRRRAKGA